MPVGTVVNIYAPGQPVHNMVGIVLQSAMGMNLVDLLVPNVELTFTDDEFQ